MGEIHNSWNIPFESCHTSPHPLEGAAGRESLFSTELGTLMSIALVCFKGSY